MCSSRCACWVMVVACTVFVALSFVTLYFPPPKDNILSKSVNLSESSTCKTTPDFPRRSKCIIQDPPTEKKVKPKTDNVVLCYRETNKCKKPTFPRSLIYILVELQAVNCNKPVRGKLCEYRHSEFHQTLWVGCAAIAAVCFLGMGYCGSRVLVVDGPDGRRTYKY